MTAPILRSAAQAYRDGRLTWGKDYFSQPEDYLCRCAAGAIAYAIDPGNVDANPAFMPTGVQAMTALARYLIDVLDATDCRYSDGQPDLIETVGGWNDQAASVADIIAALDGAADRAVEAS